MRRSPRCLGLAEVWWRRSGPSTGGWWSRRGGGRVRARRARGSDGVTGRLRSPRRSCTGSRFRCWAGSSPDPCAAAALAATIGLLGTLLSPVPWPGACAPPLGRSHHRWRPLEAVGPLEAVAPLEWVPPPERTGPAVVRRPEHQERHEVTDGARSGKGARWRRRLLLLLAAALLCQAFITPASQLRNEYLRRERAFSPGRISLLTVLTVLPGAIGIVVGGRPADTRGRRRVDMTAVTGAVVGALGAFSVGGWPMWIGSAIGSLAGAAVIPALSVYGPELFGTHLRGAARGY